MQTIKDMIKPDSKTASTDNNFSSNWNYSLTGEELREAVATGNEMRAAGLLGVYAEQVVNSQNSVNGWTALHWACKRGHISLVRLLLKYGADPQLMNNSGETAGKLTRREDILSLLKEKRGISNNDEFPLKRESELPVIANYLSSPVFPHGLSTSSHAPSYDSYLNNYSAVSTSASACVSRDTPMITNINNDLVLKIRVADSEEKDFYEVDLSRRSALTYDMLLSTMCDELNVDRVNVRKLRKLPDTVIRKDRDVERLKNFQELELVLK